MIPTSANLSALIGQQITLDPTLGLSPGGLDGAAEKSYGVTLTAEGGTVKLEKDAGGDGAWVPYAEGKAVVGYLSGQTWVASGPFSGCQLAVGKNRNTGQVFAAHIARQSGSTAEADYAKYRGDNNLTEWYINKIPMPNQNAFSCSYVFVQCGGGGIVTMARLDVDVTSMGGSNGRITHVHTFK